jgi:ABC-type branched-subunit amino acid transport system substrate-binding protein
LLFAPAARPAAEISNCRDYVFRIFSSDELQGKGSAELAVSVGYKEAVLAYINNDWGVGQERIFKDSFLKAEGKTVIGRGFARADESE